MRYCILSRISYLRFHFKIVLAINIWYLFGRKHSSSDVNSISRNQVVRVRVRFFFFRLHLSACAAFRLWCSFSNTTSFRPVTPQASGRCETGSPWKSRKKKQSRIRTTIPALYFPSHPSAHARDSSSWAVGFPS